MDECRKIRSAQTNAALEPLRGPAKQEMRRKLLKTDRLFLKSRLSQLTTAAKSQLQTQDMSPLGTFSIDEIKEEVAFMLDDDQATRDEILNSCSSVAIDKDSSPTHRCQRKARQSRLFGRNNKEKRQELNSVMKFLCKR